MTQRAIVPQQDMGREIEALLLEANSKAELCAFKGLTLRIECNLVQDNRPEIPKAWVEKMPVLKPALGKNGVMYYLIITTPTFFPIFAPARQSLKGLARMAHTYND